MKCTVYGWYGERETGTGHLLDSREVETMSLSKIRQIIKEQEYKYDWYEIIFQDTIKFEIEGEEKCLECFM